MSELRDESAQQRIYSDKALKNIRKELSKIEELVLKTLYSSPLGIMYQGILENSVLSKDESLKGMEVRGAIETLSEKNLLKLSPQINSGTMVSITVNTHYLFLITDLKKTEITSLKII